MGERIELKVGQRWVFRHGAGVGCDDVIVSLSEKLVHTQEPSGYPGEWTRDHFRETHTRLRRDDELPGYVAPEPEVITYHGEVNGLLRLEDRDGFCGVQVRMNNGTEPVLVEVPFADAPRLGDRCRIVFVRGGA